jgi:hypothetical protein
MSSSPSHSSDDRPSQKAGDNLELTGPPCNPSNLPLLEFHVLALITGFCMTGAIIRIALTALFTVPSGTSFRPRLVSGKPCSRSSPEACANPFLQAKASSLWCGHRPSAASFSVSSLRGGRRSSLTGQSSTLACESVRPLAFLPFFFFQKARAHTTDSLPFLFDDRSRRVGSYLCNLAAAVLSFL